MKVLTTSTDAQSMSIIPRSYPESITIRLRNESRNEVTNYTDVNATNTKGYLVFSNAYTLTENVFYELTILSGSNVIYKDRIFCTNQNIANFSINASTEEWIEANIEWHNYSQDWNGSEYISEPTYDNDYILL